jgi:hypothetical protein
MKLGASFKLRVNCVQLLQQRPPMALGPKTLSIAAVAAAFCSVVMAAAVTPRRSGTQVAFEKGKVCNLFFTMGRGAGSRVGTGRFQAMGQLCIHGSTMNSQLAQPHRAGPRRAGARTRTRSRDRPPILFGHFGGILGTFASFRACDFGYFGGTLGTFASILGSDFGYFGGILGTLTSIRARHFGYDPTM